MKPLEELRKEGEAGQRKINQYTRYGTIILSIIQGFGDLDLARRPQRKRHWSGGAGDVVADPGWLFRLMTVLALTTGTAFMMWLGEQITERGIGNGISLIIFAGIVANLPDALFQTWTLAENDQIQPINMLSHSRCSSPAVHRGHLCSSSGPSGDCRSPTRNGWSGENMFWRAAWPFR